MHTRQSCDSRARTHGNHISLRKRQWPKSRQALSMRGSYGWGEPRSKRLVLFFLYLDFLEVLLFDHIPFIQILFIMGSSSPGSLNSKILPQQVLKSSKNSTVFCLYDLISIINKLLFSSLQIFLLVQGLQSEFDCLCLHV